jgi:hypothetical protein
MFAQKKLFVRVYNLHGKKINTGRVLSVTDSTVELDEVSHTGTIFVKDIGSIRTKHSMGHSILMGSLVGTATGAIIAAATTHPAKSDPNTYQIEIITPEEQAEAVIFLGFLGGTAVGAIAGAAKNSEHFLIHGDPTKWKSFEKLAAAYTAKEKKQ